MLNSIFTELSTIVSGVVDMFSSLFTNVVKLIYVAPDSTNNITGGLTDVGKLILIGLGFTLFYFVLSWIRGLIKPQAR